MTCYAPQIYFDFSGYFDMSFGQYLKQFLSESFGEVVFMHSYDLVGMKSFIEAFDPDLFIDFRVDRRFHLLLHPDPRIEAELEE